MSQSQESSIDSSHLNVQEFLVPNAPPSLFYIPNFINKAEEEMLLDKVYSAPKPKWTQLSHRKLQNWGGLPLPKGMVAEALPSWLQTYADKISNLGVFKEKGPNHVLVNEYLTGQGIMPHEDGPLFYPTVSTISLGSHTLLDFYQRLSNEESSDNPENVNEDKNATSQTSSSLKERYLLSILLEPRSLVLVCDDMYKVYLHGIEERSCDLITDKVVNLNLTSAQLGDQLQRGTRVSLTIRNVPKVLKAKLFFGKK